MSGGGPADLRLRMLLYQCLTGRDPGKVSYRAMMFALGHAQAVEAFRRTGVLPDADRGPEVPPSQIGL